MPFRTKLDFSSNRQAKQHIETIQVLSGATSFGVPFNLLPTGANLGTSGITNSYFGLTSSFSGNSGTTIYSWSDPRMSLSAVNLSALTPSNSATTQNTGQVYQGIGFITIDGNISATGYTGTSFDINVTGMTNLGGGNYSGYVYTTRLDILSATSLDFTGRTIWADVSGITRTQDLIITDNPVIGRVWTCINGEGKGGWLASSGVEVTGGTYNNSTGTATFTNSTGGTFTVTGFTTGSTSGSSGSLVYGYAAGQSTTVIGANADVVFDLGATPFPNAGFTSVPSPGGTSFVVGTTGDYEFDFYVLGTHAAGATTPLQFALWRNGAVASVGGNAFEFSSNEQGGATDVQLCTGHGFIHLTAADVITLHNRTNTITDTVSVTSIGGGVGAGRPNRTLSLQMLTSGGSGGSGNTFVWTAGTGSSSVVLSGSNGNASGDYSIAGGNNSIVTGDRSAVIGGDSLTGAANDTVYVPNLIVYSGLSPLSKFGLNTLTPAFTIDAYGLNSRLYYNEGSVGYQAWGLSGGSDTITTMGGGTDGTGIGIGMRGSTEPGFPGYGKHLDSHLYAGMGTNGLNIITDVGGGSLEKYIRIYAGQNANGTIPDIHVQGTGTTRGYVAVGHSSPTEQLDVNLNARFRTIGASASTGALYYTATGVLTTNTSDSRLKTNVVTITSALDKVKSLRGVYYNWNENPTGDTRVGFIAQEINAVVPELTFINSNSKDKYMGVHYDNVTALLVEAIKELANSGSTIHLETQTILAEDNNIDLNYSGNSTTAIGGGLSVLHALGPNNSAQFITDANGNWITNNDLKPKALTIPTYTPTSSSDANGSDGNITKDDNYLYVKINTVWKRINLQNF